MVYTMPMDQLPLLAGLGYLGYLAWLGLRGDNALLCHFWLMLVLVVLGNVALYAAIALGWQPPWN